MIKQERIVVEVPLRSRAVTVVTVSEVTGDYHFGDDDVSFYCFKRPVAVAVATREGVRAFDNDGEEMETAEFIGRFPDARPLLEKRLRARRKPQKGAKGGKE
jgi:hypothetical protein